MRKIALLLLIAVCMAPCAGFAQDAVVGEDIVAGYSLNRSGDSVVVSVELLPGKADLRRTQMMVLQPVLTSADGVRSERLPALIIAGRNRAKALDRSLALKEAVEMGVGGTIVIVDGAPEKYLYEISAPYAVWMREGVFTVERTITGCASCSVGKGDVPILTAKGVLPYHTPRYRVTAPVDEGFLAKAEDIGQPKEFGFVFNRGQAEVVMGLGGNAGESAELEQALADARLFCDVTNISVTGYASPEGTSDYNARLSQERAEAFAGHLIEEYRLPAEIISIDWKGADWQGLADVLEGSDFNGREGVLDIINSIPGHDEKLRALAGLDGGAVYGRLLEEVFPSLRQVALDIRFTVSPEVLRAGRRLEAVRRAVSLIDQDRHMDAVTVLEPYSSHPDTWNILGAAYGHAGDMASAEQFFNKAASAGCRQGAHNLAELRRSRE